MLSDQFSAVCIVIVPVTTAFFVALLIVMSSTLILPVLSYVLSGVITPRSIPVATVKVLISEPGSYGFEIVLLLKTATSFTFRLDGSYVGTFAIASTLPVCGSITIALARVAPLRFTPAARTSSTFDCTLRSIVSTIFLPFTAGFLIFLSVTVNGTSRTSVTVFSSPSLPASVSSFACSKPYFPCPSPFTKPST